MVPDLWIEEHGRIGELALGRTALVAVALGRCPPASSRVACGRHPPLSCALVLGETGLAVTGRGLLTATDHVDSVRVSPLAEELTVTRSPASFS